MATLTKTSTVEVNAPAETTWDFIVWEHWPNALANGMHSPVRDDLTRKFVFHHGRGSGRSVGQIQVTPQGPASCSLHVSWQTLDIGFVVAAAFGGRSEKAVKAMCANLKAGAEHRAAAG